MSQITTHVLNTATGEPAEGVEIVLLRLQGEEFEPIGQGKTNANGRIVDLLETGMPLEETVYKMVFHTGPYFEDQEIDAFYPFVEITFYIFDQSHYHIPLLISPFGYSTYRGS